jgi:hypothetical protein
MRDAFDLSRRKTFPLPRLEGVFAARTNQLVLLRLWVGGVLYRTLRIGQYVTVSSPTGGSFEIMAR